MDFLPLILFGAAAVYFGLKLWQIVPTLVRLLAALWSGQVKWPGPRIHNVGPDASTTRKRLGIGYEDLFSTFLMHTLSVIGAFVYFLLTFIINTSLLDDHIVNNSSYIEYLIALGIFWAGRYASKNGQRIRDQVDLLLSDLKAEVEPRTPDAQSAKSEYSIEHPLIKYKNLENESRRAFDLFYESVRCLQDGNEMRALTLYQEAMRREPSLHKVACEILPKMAIDASSEEKGAICYWQGLHYEYLMDLNRAEKSYQEAAKVYNEIGYKKRESRAHCNLGRVKMHMGDGSGMEEFETATVLDPKNGIAYLNIARAYYSIGSPGDHDYELALDAFANAVRADPVAYTPDVLSSLREIGYTWSEDWEEIAKRVQSHHTDDT